MKRSLAVGIPAGMSLVGCTSPPPPRIDPCDKQVFDTQACEQAIANRGTWNGGVWIPFVWGSSLAWYAARHREYVGAGGRVTALPRGYYAQGWRPPTERLEAMRASPAVGGFVVRPPAGQAGFRSRAFTYGAPGRAFARSGGFGGTGRAYGGGRAGG